MQISPPTRQPARLLIFSLLTLTAFIASNRATAADDASYVSAMRYVSLDAQGDNADSRDVSATGSFTLGNYMWLQGTLGKITDSSSDSLGDLRQTGFGAGFATEHLQLSLNTSSVRSDGSYRQRDLAAALDWNADRFGIGLDVTHRSTDNSTDSTRDFSRLSLTNVALHIDETLTGNGIGLHAHFDLTDALSLSVGGISYHYDSDYVLTSSTNPTLVNVLRTYLSKHPTVADTFYLNNSGVTRSLALLDNSYNLGLSYQFDATALSAQYFRDKALDTDDVTNTFTLGASVFIGEYWMLSPMLGTSSSDSSDAVTFGGLSLSYNW